MTAAAKDPVEWSTAELRAHIDKMWLRQYPEGTFDQTWLLAVGQGAGMLSVAADMIERRDRKITELERSLKVTQGAAKTGMNAAHTIANAKLSKAERLYNMSSPQALNSERQANAILTERVAELEQELVRMRALVDGTYL